MRSYSGLLLAMIIILYTSACNKKPEQVGLGLQPVSAALSVEFSDTSGLISYSVREDSVRTDINVLQTGMVGHMMDDVFGQTTAEIFSQFRLSENDHDFGEEPVFDSLVLKLAYSGFYGDSLGEQRVKVFRLSEDMDPDTSYYSNQMIAWDEEILADTIFVPRPSDSLTIDGNAMPAHLRIKLKNSFGEDIINAGTEKFADNEAWLEYMKGLRITAEPVGGEGGIMLFDMFAANSEMRIYYKSSDFEDTLSFSFKSNSNCATFTAFDHNDYVDASPELQAQIKTPFDTAAGQHMFYLQSMGGVKATLRLPNIKDYFTDGSPVAINEAKLTFHVYDDGSELAPPPQLAIAMIDEEGDYVPLPDATESSGYYGGGISDGDNAYFFRISRFMQQVLTGETPNYPLVLIISGASFRANRLILHGPDEMTNGDQRMRLDVTYTMVN